MAADRWEGQRWRALRHVEESDRVVVTTTFSPWVRHLRTYAVEVVVLTAVVAAVVVPTVLVSRANSRAAIIPADRISCLGAMVTEEACKDVGCIWAPHGDGEAPSCFFPSTALHGYVLTTTQGPTSVPGVTSATLELKNTSARVVPDLRKTLKVEMIEYSPDMFRIKVTVPGEERFEPPIPLTLPSPSTQDRPSYNVTFGEGVGSDFTLVVRRSDTGVAIFDTGVGGFTYADQFLQVATRLASRNLYGLGESHHASLRHNLNYLTWPMFARDQPPAGPGENLYGAHPMYMVLEETGEAHAVLWLNSNAMEAETMPLPGLTLRSIGGVMDLYFFLGPSPTEVLQQYTSVIGRPVLPPYWALGFHLCRYGYNSLDNLKAAVTRTRRQGIPQDVQYADIDHMDRRMDFTLDNTTFLELPEYIRTVKEEGLRFIIILDPAINAELGEAYPVHMRALESDVYIKWPQELVPQENFGAGDVMLGYVWPDNRTAFPDFFRNSTKEWWKGEIDILYNGELGIEFDGLWIDMNEPANFGTNDDKPWNWPVGWAPWSLSCPNSTWDDPPYTTAAATKWGEDSRLSDKTLCMVARQGEERELRHYDVHNLYGWSQTQPTLEALQEVTGKRGIVVTRSTFPSSGRWAGHWLGDNAVRWTDMHKSIIGMMEFNLFGIPYVGADICGFFGNTMEELCARWMEVGAFYPYSRNHNTKDAIDHDPGLWPSVAASGRAALETRYTLLPYLYTLHHLASTQGHAVVKPLFFEFPNEESTWDVDDQFLWGSWLMIAPVVGEGKVSRMVYFPPASWYNYYTGKEVEETGSRQEVAAPQGYVPIYVRGGAVLTTQRPHANTMLARTEPLGLVVAPGEDGAAAGLLYWDDGEAIDPIGTGDYFKAEISYNDESVRWEVVHGALEEARDLVLSDVRVLRVPSRPSHLLVNGSRWTTGDWHYDTSTQTLDMYDLSLPIISSFTLSWSNETDLLLPCPISYQEGRQDDSEVTEDLCEARKCVWDPSSQVTCSIPPPSVYGLEFVDGNVTTTEKGFKTRLRPRGEPLYPGGPQEVTFEVFQYADHTLRVKFFTETENRYEVPILLNLPTEGVQSPLYDVVLPKDPEPGDLFYFYVTRRGSGTILFDTRIGGLTFTDQFLSISTTLPSKNVYGLGENAHDSFRHVLNGVVWPIFSRDQGPVPGIGEQVNLYGAHPYYQCVENDGQTHGVLLLNSNAMDYQLLDYPALTFRTIGGILDLYVMLGPEPETVVSQYTSLIHRPVMPPYWALGFQLCRYGYATLQDLRDAVDRTREAEIPQDVQYGDIDYMDRRMDFTVDPIGYSGFGEYISQVKESGLRFIVILDPAINAELPAGDYPPHKRALDRGVYITWPQETEESVVLENNGGGALGRVMLGYVWPDNKTAFPSFFSQAGQDWWVDEITRFYEDIKFDGLWIDMNEPANFGTNERQPWNWPDGWEPWSLACPASPWDNPPYVTKAAAAGPTHAMADKTVCLTGEDGPYRHYDVHNLYGWAQTQPTQRAVHSLTKKRGLVVTRSTFPGSGQWSGHWLGDNRSNWTDMAHSLIGMMEFNLFGIPYVGADICGFFGNTTEELCERWMEVGAFYPYSRNHNTKGTIDQDPGLWSDTVAKSSKKALEIRYRLLPYLYTLFFQAHSLGNTVVRPVLHEFPRDRQTLGLDDQFLWGAALMVSPVLHPNTTQRQVYFPQDAWYDYYTGTPVEFPGEYVTIPAPRDFIPLHLRGGHILPTQQPALNTAQARRLPMGVVVAIGRDRRASGQLFWDDGESINTVAKKKYSLVEFSFVQDTLTGTVQANFQEDLAGLILKDLEFLGVEQEPSEVLFQGDVVPKSKIVYEEAAMRLKVEIEHHLNLRLEVKLRSIWQYQVDM